MCKGMRNEESPVSRNSGGKGRLGARFRGCVPRQMKGCGAVKKLCSKATFYLILWLIWLFGGTLYYSYVNHLGFWVGFYQAVNIGYSIGYGYPREPMEQNWWFSSAYVVLGASFVGVALGFFADKIVEDSQDWFLHMIEKQKYEEETAPDKPLPIRLKAFIKFHWALFRSILLWLIWVGIMIMYSMIQVKWPFSAAQYFAVSTCSTGGHMPIPDDSPQWLFGVTGFFAAIGVPLMGVAMASLGALLMERRDDMDEMKKVIEADVSAEEILDLQRFGLEDGDGEIDKAEFVILCMVRLGTDPRLVQFISEHFQKLDDDGSNSLSILEITRGRVSSEDLLKLGQSEAYRSSRRLSVEPLRESGSRRLSVEPVNPAGRDSAVSLPSINEGNSDAEDEDEENQRGAANTESRPGQGDKAQEKDSETERTTPLGELADDFEDNGIQSDGSDDGIFF